MSISHEFEKTTGTLSLVPGVGFTMTATPLYQRDTFLLGVFLHSSVNITETVTVTRVSADGSTYDVVLNTSNLTSASNYVYVPTFPVPIQRGDSIKVTCTAANTTGVVYATVILGGR
jgi:hypothetical protein